MKGAIPHSKRINPMTQRQKTSDIHIQHDNRCPQGAGKFDILYILPIQYVLASYQVQYYHKHGYQDRDFDRYTYTDDIPSLDVMHICL